MKCIIYIVLYRPIQGEGGDNEASPYFFQGIRDITQRLGVLMIVDEVQTGVGATGKFWAHEHWNLTSPPDMVTFSKKMQGAGFYHNLSLRPKQTYRNFNTWMGDPIRAYEAELIIQEIEKYNLLNLVQETGNYLKSELMELSRKFPNWIQNVRGQGTYMAFDVDTLSKRDQLVRLMRLSGVNMGGSGEISIRMRPMLIFSKKHSDLFLNVLESHLMKLNC